MHIQLTGLERLSVRRERLVHNLFNKIKCSNHVLNNLLPVRIRQNISYAMRDEYPYSMPRVRTERPLRSFISYCVRKRF